MKEIKNILLLLVVYIFLLFAGLYIHVNSRISTANAAEPKQDHAVKQCPVPAAQPKTDPCKKFADKAKEHLKEAEYYRHATLADLYGISAAYSSYYLVCRDLERQK